jgi:ornithine carbamoyltransferase
MRHPSNPEGYQLIPDVLDVAQKHAAESGGAFRVVHSMEEAFNDADIVYPKSWAPYHVMEERTKLLYAADHAGLQNLEARCLDHNADFKHWECQENMMALTKAGSALYMHCLPADISGVSCETGEVSKAVFEQYRVHTYKEASWKPFIIAAMIFLGKFQEPDTILLNLLNRPAKRIA